MKVRRSTNTKRARNSRKPLDPTKVRVSKYFMLSDFMGCDSVYRRGLCNRIYHSDIDKVTEGVRLAQFLDRIEYQLGIVSISYGYISPALSKSVVTYQDPNKPSFHRWDLGAACDLRVMSHNWNETPPLETASNIADLIDDADFSRMITYSESPQICFATSTKVEQNNRRIHEYRYTGTPKAKPEWYKWQGKEDELRTLIQSPNISRELGNWTGSGYPTYHGGGRRQYQHVQLSQHVVLSDLLYSRDYVHIGIPNRPLDNLEQFVRAAEFMERLYQEVPNRVSIVGGYEAKSDRSRSERSYERGFYLELIPCEGTDHDTFMRQLRAAATNGERIGVDESTITKYHVRG